MATVMLVVTSAIALGLSVLVAYWYVFAMESGGKSVLVCLGMMLYAMISSWLVTGFDIAGWGLVLTNIFRIASLAVLVAAVVVMVLRKFSWK